MQAAPLRALKALHAPKWGPFSQQVSGFDKILG
jgi:hypothetical protein